MSFLRRPVPLWRHAKPVTLVELTGEDHYLSKASTRTQAIEAAVAFVQKNNPPD